MSKYTSNISPGEIWIREIKAALKERGWLQKDLADYLKVDPSSVTRMLQGKQVRTGVVYKASVKLGVPPPPELPADPLQQRLLVALVNLRDVVEDEQAEVVVAHFEKRVKAIVAAFKDLALEDELEVDDEGNLPSGSGPAEFLKRVFTTPK